MRKIIFYKTTSGQKPIEGFLETLSSKAAQKVVWVLKLVEELDRVPSQYFEKILSIDDLWEVRVKAGSNIFRFIGFFDEPNLFVLVHAFQKKTQKIPKQVIKLAKERKHEYFMRRRK